MVKSKRMSKTSIAVIILALLLVLSMVLGLTGAWFTKNTSDTDGGAVVGSLKFGSLGSVSVTVTDASWVDADGKNVITSGTADSTHVVRSVAMPGDEITGTGISIAYTQGSGSESEVYYLIQRSGDSKYFVIDNGSLSEVLANGDAGVLGSSAQSITAAKAQVSVSGTPVNITRANADLIGNAAEGGDVVFQNGFIIGEQTYTLLVCQKTNLSADEAAALLMSADHDGHAYDLPTE